MSDVINVTVSDPGGDVINVQVIEAPPVTINVEISEVGAQGIPGPPGPPGGPGSGTVDQEARDMVATHIIDPTPHPEYDDMPSLVLIFQNHLI